MPHLASPIARRRLRRVPFVLALAVLCTASVAAQPRADVDPLEPDAFTRIQGLAERALGAHAPALLEPAPVAAPSDALALIVGGGDVYAAGAAHPDAPLLAARRAALRRDLGLDLRASYLENGTEGVFDDEGASYRRRGSVELGWDLLGEGLLDRRLAARELDLDLAAADLDARALADERAYSRRFAAVIHHLNLRKEAVLVRRLDALDALIGVTEPLYRGDYVTWERLLDHTAARARTEVHLASVRSFNRRMGGELGTLAAAAPPASMRLPVFQVDAAALDSFAASDDEARLALELEQLRLREHPLRDVRLRSFVRYNAYHSPADAQALRDYVSAGLSLTVPLRLPGDDALAAATRARAEARRGDAAFGRRRELAVHLYEYDYTLQQYIGFRERERALRHRLGVALEARRLGADAYSGVETLATVDALYGLRFELLDLTQKLYLKLLEIGTYVGGDALASALTPLGAASAQPERRISAYVWSDTFARLEPAALVDALRAGGIELVYLSPGADALERAAGFVSRARALGIETHLLLGTPEVVRPDARDRIARLVADARRIGAAGIHLDVEPHTFDDWHDRRAHYLELLLDMARETRQAADAAGLALGFAVSPQYPDAWLRDLVPLADDVVLMAYDHPTPEAVPAHVRATLALAPGAMRLGVRPADFPSPEALRAFVHSDALPQPARLALHDLGALLALSPPPIDADEE